MKRQPGLFDMDERLRRLSDIGDQLEAFARVVDFEIFRADLDAALAYGDGSKGGRPPLDPVMMFKVLVIQATNNLSDDRTEFLINDRLSARTLPRSRALGPGAGCEDDLVVPGAVDEGGRDQGAVHALRPCDP